MSELIYTGKLEYVVWNVLVLVREHYTRTGVVPDHSEATAKVMRDLLPLLSRRSVT